MANTNAISPQAVPQPPEPNSLRVVLISTPRSGNNWLRYLMERVFGLISNPVHSPADVDWKGLPPNSLLALHWHAVPSFQDQLREYGYRPMVIARHPLDVFVSILHFALHYCDAEAMLRWMEGEGGNEQSIFAAMPRSTAFLNYAVSERARVLLAVSHEWWLVPGCLRIQYEDMVRNPEAEVRRIAHELGVSPSGSIEEALAATTIPKLQASTSHKPHFWQGKCGLWRKLLTAAEAQHIAAAHPDVFADLGYVCDADPTLDGASADANWINLIHTEALEARQSQAELKRELAELRQQIQAAAVAQQNACPPTPVEAPRRLRYVSNLAKLARTILRPRTVRG